jgi:hypothetical protein
VHGEPASAVEQLRSGRGALLSIGAEMEVDGTTNAMSAPDASDADE